MSACCMLGVETEPVAMQRRFKHEGLPRVPGRAAVKLSQVTLVPLSGSCAASTACTLMCRAAQWPWQASAAGGWACARVQTWLVASDEPVVAVVVVGVGLGARAAVWFWRPLRGPRSGHGASRPSAPLAPAPACQSAIVEGTMASISAEALTLMVPVLKGRVAKTLKTRKTRLKSPISERF